LRRGSAAEASDNFGGTPWPEGLANDASPEENKHQTNIKQTLIARYGYDKDMRPVEALHRRDWPNHDEQPRRIIVMAIAIKRDLYSEVTSRILAELERGAAPWVRPWSATPGQNVPQNAVSNRSYSGCNVILLWLTRGNGWPTPRFVTFKQAQEAGGTVRKGEHGTKVYYWKQLAIKEERENGEQEDKLIPMMREYTVFNVAQCEGLPASVVEGKPAWVRNPDTRDTLADEFLTASGAAIREGQGEAYYAQGADFISLPAFAAFRGADHFYNVAFHELTHWTGHKARLDRDLK
jgi:antirestriction protein ArdC